jgi:hypothetical protein
MKIHITTNHQQNANMPTIYFSTITWKTMKPYFYWNAPELMAIVFLYVEKINKKDEFIYKFITYYVCMCMILKYHCRKIIANLTHDLENTREISQNSTPPVLHDEFPTQTECTICCKPYDETKTQLLSCGHKFHLSCIFNWFSQTNTCPICRQKHVITNV